MGANPEEIYQRQKRLQHDQERSDVAHGAHQTMETWQLEQQEAESGRFKRDPLDKSTAKPSLLARIRKTLFGK